MLGTKIKKGDIVAVGRSLIIRDRFQLLEIDEIYEDGLLADLIRVGYYDKTDKMVKKDGRLGRVGQVYKAQHLAVFNRVPSTIACEVKQLIIGEI